jgi:hypothetical protein
VSIHTLILMMPSELAPWVARLALMDDADAPLPAL